MPSLVLWPANPAGFTKLPLKVYPAPGNPPNSWTPSDSVQEYCEEVKELVGG